MEKRNQPSYTMTARSIILLAVGSLLCLLSACVTPTDRATPSTVPQKAAIKTPQFESDDYIIYVLQQEEDPIKLAERFLGDRNKAWIIEQSNPDISYEKDQVVIIPKNFNRKGGLSLKGYQKVPIFCYHHFADACNSSLCITANNFDEQMRYLKDNGYRTITLRDMAEFLRYEKTIPEKAVIITIDDGYRSAYQIAYPILKKYEFVASLFVYTDFVGSCRNAVTWDQLREMKSHGFDIGSHTITHCDLTQKNESETNSDFLARITRELRESKALIDKELNQETLAIAFPYGCYNSKVVAICDKAGYKLGLTVKRGSNPFFAPSLRLRRSQLLQGDLQYFKSNLKTFYEFSKK
ncbi:MAG: polysaccharide deacetylase family protein [Thermodesulfobacteriota bacterium]